MNSARERYAGEDMKSMRWIVGLATVLASNSAIAQYTGGIIKVGVLSDFSSIYADTDGAGGVAAARLAIEDFGAASKGMKVEIVSGDHQNKADLGATIAGSWLDVAGVDVILGGGSSAVALAVNEVVRQRNKVLLVSDGATSDLTGPKCSPNTIHWTYDTWMLANGTGRAVVKTGGTSWFFLTADYETPSLPRTKSEKPSLDVMLGRP
jgi:branched-chain amino acid transport system substrate-binding protein